MSSSSESYRATERFQRDFGDDAVVVLVKGDLQKTMLSTDLGRLIRLEGCLSGKVPEEGLRTLPDGCRELGELRAAKVVFGPGTFINTAVNQITEEFTRRTRKQAADAQKAATAARKLSAARGDPEEEQERLAGRARQLVQGRFQAEIARLGLRYGITGIPTISNADFVSSVVFDQQSGQLRPAQVALRLSVPQPRRGPRAGAPAPRSQRRPSGGGRSTSSARSAATAGWCPRTVPATS